MERYVTVDAVKQRNQRASSRKVSDCRRFWALENVDCGRLAVWRSTGEESVRAALSPDGDRISARNRTTGRAKGNALRKIAR
jgi:hypothetical protein